MIQRIQSLYLFIAICCIAALFFVPFARYIHEGELTDTGSVPTQQFELRLMGKYLAEGSGDPIVYQQYITEPLLALLLASLLAFIIFQFRNRLLQITAGRFALVISCAFLVLIYATVGKEINSPNSINRDYGWGIYLPIFVIGLLFLAIKAIRKDEDLVRSADRIR